LKECLAAEKPGRVLLAKRKVGAARADVAAALNAAIDRREEGLVVKDPASVYKPGARARGGWVKVKPEYSDSLSDRYRDRSSCRPSLT